MADIGKNQCSFLEDKLPNPCTGQGGCCRKVPMDYSSGGSCCVMAPFVKIKFHAGKEVLPDTPAGVFGPPIPVIQKTENVITVGNNSAPESGNTAVIRDFEFGSEDAFMAKFTIHDIAGSSFVAFMENLLKDFKCSNPDGPFIDIEFGWVHDDCPLIVPETTSPTYKLFLRDVIGNYNGGKFVYEFEAVDVTRVALESTITKIYKGTFTDAVTQLWTDEEFPPRVAKVSFKMIQNGNIVDATFKDEAKSAVQHALNTVADISNSINNSLGRFGFGGGIANGGNTKGVFFNKWPCNTLNKFQVTMNWIAKGCILSTNDKSFIIVYDATTPGGEIIILEDPKPNCNENKDWDSSCIATYVVNGGGESPVIDFNPKIKFQYFGLVGAGGNLPVGKAGDQNFSKFKGILDCKTLENTFKGVGDPGAKTVGVGAGSGEDPKETGAGLQTTGAPLEGTNDVQGKESGTKTKESISKYLTAFQSYPQPIEADLVVTGDPSLGRPLDHLYKNVKIIFINPFHIVPASESCAEWLAQPGCNEVLSNNAWLIKRIVHHISLGKYTTTLSLYLTTPGIHTNIGDAFGGPGARGGSHQNNVKGV